MGESLRTVFPFNPGYELGAPTSIGTLRDLALLLQLPRMTAATWAGIFLLAAAPDASAQPAPHRVVSLNLCADQFLLALADRDQIASLSPLVQDRSISFLADKATGIPVNEGKGEAIVFAGADLVFAATYGSQVQRELLERQGFAVMRLDPWESLADGRGQIREVAARLGHPERGERLIGDIEASLTRAKNIVEGSRSILTYYRRGWVPGSDSLIGELLRHMGFALHQDALGLAGGGVARLESIVASPPDYMLMDEVVGQSLDNGSVLLMHPALARVVPPERRLIIPGALAICGGPSTPAAIDALAAEVRAKVR
jgi:iron complex transport system substrate-binding protein